MERKWTAEKLERELSRIMGELKITHLPSVEEIRAHSSCYDTLCKYGGLRKFAKKMGVPAAEDVPRFTRKCEVCGKEFQSLKNTNKYCSENCRKLKKKQCEVCGKEFVGQGKHCSDICKAVARKNAAVEARKKGCGKDNEPKHGNLDQVLEQCSREGMTYAQRQKAETLKMAGMVGKWR